MKKLIVIFLFFLFWTAKSQVVFCPAGAEWHYSFVTPVQNSETNEQIKYVRDTIIGNEMAKVLHHNNFYLGYNYLRNNLTLIKQSGDTVFFRNLITQHSWQILYNYAALPGQKWETVVDLLDPINGPLTVTYTITVDSVQNIIVNGFNLKKLFVKYEVQETPTILTSEPAQITERFGSSRFLFSYTDFFASDGDVIDKNLCYRDNVFGLKQFTNYSCDYSYHVGLQEILTDQFVTLYPIPAQNEINISYTSDALDREFNTVRIINTLGQTLAERSIDFINDKAIISAGDIPNGIYTLQFTNKGQQRVSRPLIINR